MNFNKSVLSIVLRAVDIAAAFVVAALIARYVGPTGLGIYSLAMAVIALASVPVEYGVSNIVVRDLAASEIDDEQAASVSWGSMTIVIYYTCLVGLILAVLKVPALKVEAIGVTSVMLVISAIGLQIVVKYFGAILRGTGSILWGQTGDLVLKPLIFIMALLVLVLSTGDLESRIFQIFSALNVALLMTALVLLVLNRGVVARRLLNIRQVSMVDFRHRCSRALLLALSGGLWVLQGNIDILMLNFLAELDDVGIYRIASRGGALVAIGLTTMSVVNLPVMAAAFSKNDSREVALIAGRAAAMATVIALAGMLGLMLFGDQLVTWVFGEQFQPSVLPMKILATGYLVSCFFGVPAILMIISGREDVIAKAAVVSVLVNAALNYALIGWLGVNGAAIATACAVFLPALLMYRQAAKNLNIRSNAIVGIRSLSAAWTTDETVPR